MTHTPGPWKVDENHKGFVNIRRDVDFYTSDIATVWDFYAENYESNAHLIAAAPEMLEALEEVVALTENLPVCPFCGAVKEVQKHSPDCLSHEIEAAIRKARGEG